MEQDPSETWILDDTCVYRVSIHKSPNGDLYTTPINGWLTLFNPDTGKLVLHIIHSSCWANLQKLSTTAKEKACELLKTWIEKSETLPKEIFVTRQGMLQQILESKIEEFDSISFKYAPKHYPFQALAHVPCIAAMVKDATYSHVVNIDMYEDWLKMVKPNEALLRFILILQGIHVDRVSTFNLLDQKHIQPNHIWPNWNEDWTTLENQLKTLILNDYALKSGINDISTLSTVEQELIWTGSTLYPGGQAPSGDSP